VTQVCRRCYRIVDRACQSDAEMADCPSLVQRATHDRFKVTEYDRQLVNDPKRWPRGQVLCLKKKNSEGQGWPYCGFLVNEPDTYFPGRYTVFWDKSGRPYPARVTRVVIDSMAKEGNLSVYPTLSAMLDDGWVVD
jgi:hypothetical protein